MAFARAAARRLLGGRAKFTARSATSASRDLTGSAVHHQDLQPPVHGHSRNSRLENGVVRLDKMERSTPSRHMCTMPELPSEKSSTVTGMITVAELKELARTKTIDTVVVGLTDCYGRLVGKRYTADFFLESAVDDGTHACSYLLATDMDMEPVPGYKFASWEAGYGDIHLVPDMKTLRVASWLEKTALVLCDVVQDDHELAPHAPRSILRNQIKAAQAVGKFTPMAASELEYFLYKDTYEESKNRGYHNLKPAGWVREDYHFFRELVVNTSMAQPDATWKLLEFQLKIVKESLDLDNMS